MIMKNKNVELSFQKETISKLNVEELNNVKGGSSNACWAVTGYLTGKLLDVIIEHFSDACTAEGTTGGMS